MSAPFDQRIIKYVRHEFHGDDELCEGLLLHFVYDIPYFGACGVFPPLHIINDIFSRGTSGGGMSPGATWQSFTISAAEYSSLTECIRSTPVEQIRPFARYADFAFIFDSRFDGIQDRYEWLKAVCAEHRTEFHRRIAEEQ